MTNEAPEKILKALARIASDEPPVLPGFSGPLAMQGHRGSVRFVVTKDHDGQIEMSLSVKGPKPPGTLQIANFLRTIGANPLASTKTQKTVHFVLFKGQQR